jgi:hypothetical protein
VWPWKKGTARGIAFSPLYPHVPEAAERNPALGELLALLERAAELPIREQSNHQLGMEVGAVRRKGAGEAEDLQVAADRCGFSRPGQAQLGHRQAADGADHEAGLLLLFSHPGLHGFGPSTSPWNITSASS